MTLEEAIADLFASTEFKSIAKEKDGKGGKYRMMKSRYMAGKLKALAMVELLIQHGYKIRVSK